MDRQIVYPGSIPLDTDVLSVQTDAMVADGYLARMVLGGNVVADGLVCTPTTPASLSIVVGAGALLSPQVIEASAFGSLPPNTAALMKLGINTGATQFGLSAPGTPGQTISYLIQAAFSEADTGATVLPYYNAANPAQPYSGPNNAATAQNTQRVQRVALQLKPGAPANMGAQTTPAADTGYSPLWVITVSYGQTTVTAANISVHAQAPFVPFTLPQLTPGFRNRARITVGSTWTLPFPYTSFRTTVVGGGGGGGNCAATSINQDASGSGGGGGGRAVTTLNGQAPGSVFTVVVGKGGAPQATGGTSSLANASGVVLCSATGGNGGNFQATASSAGGTPGVGVVGDTIEYGGHGSDGQSAAYLFAGNGGGAPDGGGGGRAGNKGGVTSLTPGGGGGGAYDSALSGTNYNGGSGADGYVLIEW